MSSAQSASIPRLPGVYLADRDRHDSSMKMDRSCVVGFVGLAERGPVDEPVRCRDFNHYLKTFGGFAGPGHLAHAIHGFFTSGGKECVVVRVAHQGGDDGACPSSLVLPGREHEDAFKLKASSLGVWGNRMTVKLWHATAARMPLSSLDQSDSRTLELRGSNPLIAGDFVRVQSEDVNALRLVTSVEDARITLDQEIPGLASAIEKGIKLELVSVNLSVVYRGKTEDHLGLSINPRREDGFVDRVNQRSSLIRIESLKGESSFPLEMGSRNLSGGHDGILNIEPGDFIGEYRELGRGRGLGIFEGIPDISVVCVPDAGFFSEILPKSSALDPMLAVQRAMVDHAERIPCRFAILDTPDFEDAVQATQWAKRFDSAYAALYYPYVLAIDPEDPQGIRTKRQPVSGHVAGVFSATDAEFGSMRAPAGFYLPGVVGLGRELDPEEAEYAYDAKVNTLKRVPGKGVKVWGARTLSSDLQWRYINVRRSFSRISQAIKSGMAWAVFEPQGPGLRKRVVRSVTAFLLDIWREGFLVGKTPDEAFMVRCDDELNPLENIDKGILTTQIGLALSKPTEFIVIQLEAEREGSTVVIEDSEV